MGHVSALWFLVHSLQWLLLVLGWLLLAVLLLLLLTLSLPASFAARAEGALAPDEAAEYGLDGRLLWRLRFTWGWRLLRADLAGENFRVTQERFTLFGRTPTRGRKAARKGAGKSGTTETVRKQKQPKPRGSRWFRLSDWRIYRDEGRWLIRRAWRALRLEGTGDLAYGFDDPALTGLTAGGLAAAGMPRGFRFTPDFCATGVRGWAAIEGRTYGLQLLALAVAFLFRPAIRRIWVAQLKHSFRSKRKAREGGQAA